MTDSEIFMNYIGENYKQLKKRFKAFCFDKSVPWSEDVFQTTIVRCYDAISKKGKLNDKSSYGIESFFFMAFKTNSIRELEYAYNKNRDSNFDSTNISDAYEKYKETNDIDAEEKVTNDLFNDFCIKTILDSVEENFELIDYRLFKIKTFSGYSYKKISDLTHIRDCKNRIVKVKNWVKQNISRKDLEMLFDKYQQQIC